MEVLTLNELKGLCLQRELPVSGTKAELIERLSCGSFSRAASSSTTYLARASEVLFPNDYDALRLPQLKEMCRERLLPVGGIKEDIVNRLKASDPRYMSLVQLKIRCRDAALPVTGTKADLVDRVMKNTSSSTTSLLQSKSVDDLKELCQERGLPVMGKKDELVDRLKLSYIKTTTKTPEKPPRAALSSVGSEKDISHQNKKGTASPPSFVSMTIPQLKELCREKKLPVGGTKDELVERTSRSSPVARSASVNSASGVPVPTMPANSDYGLMAASQLKDLCRSRTIPVMGTKDELIKRLKEHDNFVRVTFKKRKNPIAESAPAHSAVTSNGSKRPATSARPKAKKARATSQMSSGSNSAPLEAKKSVHEEKHSTYERYVVYSTCAYPLDGWHSYAGPGEPTFYESYASKEEANNRVNNLFYSKNPWGLDLQEMDDTLDIDERWENGLLKLSVCPPDSEEWVVAGKQLGARATDEDSDVVMVSGSDTEDERYVTAF